MDQYQTMNHEQFLFGTLMMVTNQMKTVLDQDLKEYGVTAAQLYMSMLVQYLNNGEPTIKEVAHQMRSSHQNIKQIALKMSDKGLIELKTDVKDKRVTRLSLTPESDAFWKQIEPKAFSFMDGMFKGINEEQKSMMKDSIILIINNLETMYVKGKDI